VLGSGVDDFAVGLDGLVYVSQPDLIHTSEPVLEFQDLVGALPDIGLARENLREFAPTLGLREQTIEGANGVLILGFRLENSPVARDRVVDVLELNFVDLGHPEPELHDAFRFRHELLELTIVESGHRRPALDEARQALERTERVFVLAVLGHGPRVRLERLRRVPEAFLVERGNSVQQLDAIERILREAHFYLEHAHELEPLAHRLVHGLEDGCGSKRFPVASLDALERRERRRMVGLDAQNVAIELDRAPHVAEVLLVELGDSVLVADRFRRIAGELGLVRQDSQELGPVLRRLIEDV
jgi:hypothetical protein